MSTATRIELVLEEVNCGKCGVWFGLERRYHTERQRDKVTFYCPNGHPRAYVESEIDQLKRQLAYERDSAASARAARDQAEASLRATKGVVTKMRKRAIVGACQFCHRNFANVARHVATVHPDAEPEA